MVSTKREIVQGLSLWRDEFAGFLLVVREYLAARRQSWADFGKVDDATFVSNFSVSVLAKEDDLIRIAAQLLSDYRSNLAVLLKGLQDPASLDALKKALGSAYWVQRFADDFVRCISDLSMVFGDHGEFQVFLNALTALRDADSRWLANIHDESLLNEVQVLESEMKSSLRALRMRFNNVSGVFNGARERFRQNYGFSLMEFVAGVWDKPLIALLLPWVAAVYALGWMYKKILEFD